MQRCLRGLVISLYWPALSFCFIVGSACHQQSKQDFFAAKPQVSYAQEAQVESSNDQNITDLSEDNDSQALEPVAIGGAFLVSCSWLEEDSTRPIGIGGCQLDPKSNPNASAAYRIESLRMETTSETITASMLDGAGAYLTRFEIPHRLYGEPVKVTLEVTDGIATQTISGIELKNLPVPLVATPTAMPTTTVSTPQSFALAAFKLGDDGPTGSAQCSGLQTLAANNKLYGTRATISLNVLADQDTLKFSFSRICGNGSGGTGSVTLTRMEIRRAADNSIVSTDTLPASSIANDIPDGTNPTASFVTRKTLAKGSYFIEVIVGRAMNNALDDLMIEKFEITGTNYKIMSQTVK